MTTYLITRHPGALEWAARQQLVVDQFISHLDPGIVQRGDTVIGSLPVNLAAKVCEAGARYLHLSLEVTPELRGCELSANQMEQLSAHVQAFEIRAAVA